MRFGFAFAALLLVLIAAPGKAQVAPAARIDRIRLDLGGGISDFTLDYGPGRRMIGVSAWLNYNLFHGLGIAAKGTSIFADKPTVLERMRQDSITGGAVYRPHPVLRLYPEMKYIWGIGSIDFPSGNPLYTHDTYTISAIEGGAEYHLWNNLFAHGDYEYQSWLSYHGLHDLNPNGFTFGATYRLRGIHRL